MAKHSKQTKHHHRSALTGFMEPTAGATHHEDIYGISQFEEDRAESYAFDVCDDDDDDGDDDEDGDGDGGNIDRSPSKRRRVSSGPSSGSRGAIKKPKYKPLPPSPGNKADNPLDLTSEADEVNEVEPGFEHDSTDPHTWFKISPRQNSRHSISVSVTSAIDEPDHIEQADGTLSPSDSRAKRNAETFSTENSIQHQHTSSARFSLVRKQRWEDREQIYAAGKKARKVKAGTVRDAGFLIDGVPSVSCEPYVQVDRSEAPEEFLDLTSGSLRVVAKEAPKSKVGRSALLSKKALPLKNWKGEILGLGRGAVYVLIVVDE